MSNNTDLPSNTETRFKEIYRFMKILPGHKIIDQIKRIKCDYIIQTNAHVVQEAWTLTPFSHLLAP